MQRHTAASNANCRCIRGWCAIWCGCQKKASTSGKPCLEAYTRAYNASGVRSEGALPLRQRVDSPEEPPGQGGGGKEAGGEEGGGKGGGESGGEGGGGEGGGGEGGGEGGSSSRAASAVARPTPPPHPSSMSTRRRTASREERVSGLVYGALVSLCA